MGVCEVCKNYYDKTFSVILDDVKHEFDSMECAAHALCPVCAHCGVRVMGHGVEVYDKIFCSAHCAKTTGQSGIHDRFPEPDLMTEY